MENCDAAYPPISQVESLWESCVAVDADREVTGYLEKRDIAVSGVVEQDCARALPVGLVVPAWATYSSRPWNETGHRLLVPLFDHLGTMRSLLARSVAPNPEKKSVGASGGYHRRGLIMAATFGRQLLVSGPVRGLHRTENFRLTVFEGEVDFLRGAASGADCELSDAVSACGFRGAVGIVSGSFTRDIAARVPRHTTIVLATDDDAQGDKYASDITALVGTKANYERVRPEKD
jgi:hypothetical protein